MKAKFVRESLNEESGYYPAGAEFDPRAPYNQEDEPEWDGDFDYYFNKKYPGWFGVHLTIKGRQATGTISMDSTDLLDNAFYEPDPVEAKWIMKETLKGEKTPEFDERLYKMLDHYVNEMNPEFEWEPNYYNREEMNDY